MIKAETIKVVRYPADVLRKKSLPIQKITAEIFDLSEMMTAVMQEYDGVGLAANQIGRLLQIFVLNTTPFEDKFTPVTMINPAVIDTEGVVEDEEGCLSFPKLYLRIPRPQKVRVSVQNLYNERLVFEAEDFLARAVMHEIDHLNGVLFTDHARKEDLDLIASYVNGTADGRDAQGAANEREKPGS